jgi:hypothetical protein
MDLFLVEGRTIITAGLDRFQRLYFFHFIPPGSLVAERRQAGNLVIDFKVRV